MAKTPTLATWELDLLRGVENVVRPGHIRHVETREIVLERGVVPLAPGSLVVHCAASGLRYPPLVPVWGPDKVRLQTVRVGFPCFCAALAGYVEATRDDDRERNRPCPPNTLPDDPASWAQMQVRGTVAARAYGAEPDIAAWANECALNPARIEPHRRDESAVRSAADRLAASQITGSLGWPSSLVWGCPVSRSDRLTAMSRTVARCRFDASRAEISAGLDPCVSTPPTDARGSTIQRGLARADGVSMRPFVPNRPEESREWTAVAHAGATHACHGSPAPVAPQGVETEAPGE